jgi:hypothetical protein
MHEAAASQAICENGLDHASAASVCGVHAEAIWAGGVDGGDFILLMPVKPDGTHAGDLESRPHGADG